MVPQWWNRVTANIFCNYEYEHLCSQLSQTVYQVDLNGECVRIKRFEDIEAWRLARELSRKVYSLTKKTGFTRDYGLKGQIQEAAGSTMHNIAEGFDSETNPEFVRFLRYAKRSCTEVQSELYVALDQHYITSDEFQDVYEHAGRTRAAIRGFINYLVSYEREQRNNSNPER